LSAGERRDSWANDASGETPEADGGGDITVRSVDVEGVEVGERCDGQTVWFGRGPIIVQVEETVVGFIDAGIGGGGMRLC
jgi:hypothetical protein